MTGEDAYLELVETAAEIFERRRERALLGAWRAGYEYVYEVWPAGDPMRHRYIPSHIQRSGWSTTDLSAVEYDLASTDDGRILWYSQTEARDE